MEWRGEMSPEQQAAYIVSQSVCAMIEAMGMQAENKQRDAIGASMAYVAADFAAVIDRYGIDHNAVIGHVRRWQR